MGEAKTTYYIYIKNGEYDALKVLFYYKDLEYYLEDGDEIVEAFLEKWWGEYNKSDVILIEKAKLDIFDVVI